MARNVPFRPAKTPSPAHALLTRAQPRPPRPHPQRQPARNQPKWSEDWRPGGPMLVANTLTNSSMLAATPSQPFTAALTSSTRHRARKTVDPGLVRALPISSGKDGGMGTCSGGRHAFLTACRGGNVDGVVDCWGGRMVMAPASSTTSTPRPQSTSREICPAPFWGSSAPTTVHPVPRRCPGTRPSLTGTARRTSSTCTRTPATGSYTPPAPRTVCRRPWTAGRRSGVSSAGRSGNPDDGD
jgi:hypothetical protein